MLKRVRYVRWESNDHEAGILDDDVSRAKEHRDNVKRDLASLEGKTAARFPGPYAPGRVELEACRAMYDDACAALEQAQQLRAAFTPGFELTGSKGKWSAFLPREALKQAENKQIDTPVMLDRGRESSLWWFRNAFFEADSDLTRQDVVALVLEEENTKRLRLEKAHALAAMREQLDSAAKRQPIPREIKLLVWQRDGGRCVECGSQQDLEYDHVIPLAMGRVEHRPQPTTAVRYL